MRARSLTAVVMMAAVVTGCKQELPQQTDAAEARDMAAPAPAKLGLQSGVAAATGAARSDEAATNVQPSDPVAPSMIIRNGSATVEVASLDAALGALRQLAQRLGGYVANTSLVTGRDQVPSATLELKIPAPRFDSAMAGLSPLGRVETVNTTAEDVGEHFVDITARLANARRLEARIQSILATRTGRLEDVIAAERELARVREEIERHEGRLRYLRTRLALSTLSVTVHEPYPVVGGPGKGPITQAFRNMWRNFVLFVAWLIASLGWLLPLGAIALVTWIGVRRVRRRRTAVAQVV